MYYTLHFIRGITIGQTERLLNFISEVIGINEGKVRKNTPHNIGTEVKIEISAFQETILELVPLCK